MTELAESGGVNSDAELRQSSSASKSKPGEKQPLVGGRTGDAYSYDTTEPPNERMDGSDGGVRFSPIDPKPVTQTHVQMVILDFTEATGLDASAARSCFLMLKQLLKVGEQTSRASLYELDCQWFNDSTTRVQNTSSSGFSCRSHTLTPLTPRPCLPLRRPMILNASSSSRANGSRHCSRRTT